MSNRLVPRGCLSALQATEVIKILLGKGDVLSGRLLVYDALKMSFKVRAHPKKMGRERLGGALW